MRIIVALVGIAGVAGVLVSVLRTVVLPRAVPARLARFTFLAVRSLLVLRLWIFGGSDYERRDRVFALQAPLGLLAQLVTWSVLRRDATNHLFVWSFRKYPNVMLSLWLHIKKYSLHELQYFLRICLH